MTKRALVCLAIGIAATFVVAWLPQWFPTVNRWRWAGAPVDASRPWPRAVPGSWPPRTLSWSQGDAITWGVRSYYAARNTVPGDEDQTVQHVYFSLHEYRFGVPFRGVSFWTTEGPYTVSTEGQSVQRHGVSMFGSAYGRNIVLPLAPLWPGFALNTLFYAALAWGAWQIPLALRRRSRRRWGGKGKCVHCGYDLTATPAGSPCPECGRAA